MTTATAFALEITGTRDVRVIRARGRLVAGAGADASVWAATSALGRPGQVLIDLRDVTALDARGVGRLLRLRQALMRHGARLTISAAGPRVRRVLQLTALDAIFGIASGDARGGAAPLGRCA